MLTLCCDTVQKIKNIVNDRPAYLMVGTPSFNDVTLSNMTGYPVLTGNPIVNVKYMSGIFVKRFLHVNSFPYMVFSQKMKSEEDMNKGLAKLIAGNTKFNNWRFEIDGEINGRGFGVVDCSQMNLWQVVKRSEDEKENLARVPEITAHLKRYLNGYMYFSCPNIYSSFDRFKEMISAKGGFVEAVPKGQVKSIGVLTFISPTGTFKILTSYELIQTERFFKMGYIWPQRDLPAHSIDSLNQKLAQKLFDQGVYGYVTIMFTVSTAKTKHLKVCIDRIIPFYDEFASIFEMLNLMTYQEKMGKGAVAVIIPKVQGLSFSKNISYLNFFERCRERNIQFDLKTKRGTVFLLSDALQRGSFGLISFEQDRQAALKSVNRSMSNIASLFENEVQHEEYELSDDMVSFNMVIEQLYSMQKPEIK